MTLCDQTPTTDLGTLLRSTVLSLRQHGAGGIPSSALYNLIQSHFGIFCQEDASVLLRALLQALRSTLDAERSGLGTVLWGTSGGTRWVGTKRA